MNATRISITDQMTRDDRRAGGLMAAVILSMVATALLLALPAAAQACANEQLRAEGHSTNLPDCRAYELVTPPFKFGQPPSTFGAVTADGDKVMFGNLGAFGEPGSDRGIEGVEYIASRATAGWSSAAVNVSISQFQGGGGVADFSEDLGETVFLYTPAGLSPIDSQVSVQSVGGASVNVGPVLEPAKAAAFTQRDAEAQNAPLLQYAGASRDLGTVLFTLFNRGNVDWYWQWDTTFARSQTLYEYTGTGNTEPDLVGVRGGPTSRELISQCGTFLGEANGRKSENVDNAISENGTTVFFTAAAAVSGCEAGFRHPAVNELYARVRNSETVAISEPTTGPTGDCASCDVSKPMEAKFQGASRSGSKVFFLSEQKLISGPAGREPTGDNLYEFDFDAPHGERVSLVAPEMASSAEGSGGVVQVTGDGTRVYLVSEDSELANNVDVKGKTAKEAAEAGEGSRDLYVYNTITRRFVFIAALAENDSGDWEASGARPSVSVTPDGRFLLFPSTAGLTADASGTGIQLYRYDAQTGEADAEADETGTAEPAVALVRVSVGQQAPGGYFCATSGEIEPGFDCDGNSAQASYAPAPAKIQTDLAHPEAAAMSADGSMVFFESAAGLTPQALNDQCAYTVEGSCESLAFNVYEWERGGAGSCPGNQSAGCVYLISDGQDANAASKESAVNLIGTNTSGSDLFFTTADSLAAQDTDGQQDIYDARVDGGFTAPTPPTSCATECQGPGSAAPVFGAPSSLTFAGGGNLTPTPAAVVKPKPKAKPVKCKKGFVKSRGRCVKKAKAKRKNTKRSSRDRRDK
jgi:hypothetical protein